MTARLAELTGAGIVERDGRGYRLTDEGQALVGSLETMNQWAHRWADRLDGPAD
ncbi:winged helix-turn-helix transcriptional regulator [Nocardioides sp. CER19]|uniref:winged helix-turn-helix transcriptional regulator n=1 Tax=Nocardioides sp. CER19 TaxID=3038538 RepID=UPI002448C5F3|nr:winged helix-turn-helix transcriptional regulator [Nocardioides sp. CER19]MDH2415942.1 winged helix-turn-helix transcriptional regulator [Nocardioides sp. CER19]